MQTRRRDDTPDPGFAMSTDLQQETIRANFMHYLLYGSFAVVMILQAWTGSMPGFVWVAGIVLLAVGLTFGTLHIRAEQRELVLRFAFFRSKIPLDNILHVACEDYSIWRFGGWGVRIASGVTLYNVMGDRGKAVRVEWTDDKQRKRTTMFSSRRGAQWVGSLSPAPQSQISAELGSVPASSS